MRKLFLFACLTIELSLASAEPNREKCATLPSDYSHSQPLTISEIEHKEMKELAEWTKARADIPKVPFGFANAKWLAFKAKVRPGDKIVEYSTDKHSWKNLAGETGYALIRSGCLIETFVTLSN